LIETNFFRGGQGKPFWGSAAKHLAQALTVGSTDDAKQKKYGTSASEAHESHPCKTILQMGGRTNGRRIVATKGNGP